MKPLILVGYMSSGKSTLGQKMARLAGLKFIDTDIFIEARFRQRIGDMFVAIGEDAFRKRERIVMEELIGMQDCVLATGGGLPCYQDSMDLLLEAGGVLYLEVSDELLAQRLELCKRTRPTVRDKSDTALLEHVRQAMAIRRPIYERAHARVSVEQIAGVQDEWRLAYDLLSRLGLSCDVTYLVAQGIALS